MPSLIRPLPFPILFISHVDYALYVFPKYPLLLRKRSVPCTFSLRTPIPGPRGKQTRAEHGRHEVHVGEALQHTAHTCTSDMKPGVLYEAGLMSRLWLSCPASCFPKCERRWDFYLLFTHHPAFLLKILLDGIDYRTSHQGSWKAKRLEKLTKNKTKEKTSGL